MFCIIYKIQSDQGQIFRNFQHYNFIELIIDISDR